MIIPILMDILWSINQDASGLDSNKIEQLIDLSSSNTKPGCLARNFLVANGLINYCEPIVLADELKSSEAKPNRPRNISQKNSRLSIFPNPANEYIIVSYDLTGLKGDFRIIIASTEGKPLIQRGLTGIKNQIIISTEQISSSIYVVNLIKGEDIIESMPIIITR